MSAIPNSETMGPSKGTGSVVQDVLDVVGQIVRSRAFWPLTIAIVGLCLFFFPLISGLVPTWLIDDHYSHGFIIPFISGYVIWKWWPNIKNIEVKPGYLAILFLIPLLYIASASMKIDQRMLSSFLFLGSLLSVVWLLVGFRWMLAVSLPILYLVFMLPVWLSIIDVWTFPLQLISTKLAYHMLALIGQQPQMDPMHPTDIYLNNFNMNIAVPCSGMKLLLAISAFTAFFLMIADIKWWARVLMLAAMIPLSLLTNGLRIAMIGMVGNWFGEEAGHKFHDYSGYIALIFCFWALFKLARGLGWKD